MLKIMQGDALHKLRELPDRSVDCCVSSPPYWNLRDYGITPTDWPEVELFPAPGLPSLRIPASRCCLGLEPDVWSFVGHMVLIYREVWRVLKDTGTIWVNLGDTYIGGGNGGGGSFAQDGIRAAKLGTDKNVPARKGTRGATVKSKRVERGSGRWGGGNAPCGSGFKPKDLAGIPWHCAMALQADGWTLRSDVIWHKPNPMPESVSDRLTKAHEYIFFLSKSGRYYYDAKAIKEPIVSDHASGNSFVGRQGGAAHMPMSGGSGTRVQWIPKKQPQSYNGSTFTNGKTAAQKKNVGQGDRSEHWRDGVEVRNKRDVWTVATQPYKEAHYATYPPDLIKPCILASCPAGGTVLDPFGGSGTTGMVALELGRKAVLIELSEANVRLIERRCAVTPGLPLA